MELYFQTGLPLEDLAQKLREVLNLPPQNRQHYQVDQHRYGLNFGGEYFLFEILGLELALMRNEGEVEIPERSDWPYYLIVYKGDEKLDECLLKYLCQVLTKAGLVVEVDDRT